MEKESLSIEGLTTEGDGVARLPDGRVLFVHDAFPGDLVRVRLGEKKKGVQHAEVAEMLKPSDDRVPSRCDARVCGGCALKGYDASAQAKWKRDHVLRNLLKIANIDLADLAGPAWQNGDGWRYRHRVRLKSKFLRKRWHFGFFERGSHRLWNLSQCPVLWPETEQAALRLVGALEHVGEEASLEDISVAYSRVEAKATCLIETRAGRDQAQALMELALKAGMGGVELRFDGGTIQAGRLGLRYDHKNKAAFDIIFEPSCFTQANPAGNERVLASIGNWLPPKVGHQVLELHAGVGNFSLALAKAGHNVVATEQHPRAAVLLRSNAQNAGLAVRAEKMRDTDALRVFGPSSHSLVLDPPRGGAKDVMPTLLDATSIERVVYISCNSSTLARDVKILIEGGEFRVVGLEVFDLFPQTPHAEALLVLDRV